MMLRSYIAIIRMIHILRDTKLFAANSFKLSINTDQHRGVSQKSEQYSLGCERLGSQTDYLVQFTRYRLTVGSTVVMRG